MRWSHVASSPSVTELPLGPPCQILPCSASSVPKLDQMWLHDASLLRAEVFGHESQLQFCFWKVIYLFCQ